jgi:hypothetical protein
MMEEFGDLNDFNLDIDRGGLIEEYGDEFGEDLEAIKNEI